MHCPLGDLRIGRKPFEPVWRAGMHVQFDRDFRSHKLLSVADAFTAEDIQISNFDVSGGQPTEVRQPRGDEAGSTLSAPNCSPKRALQAVKFMSDVQVRNGATAPARTVRSSSIG